MRYQLKCAKRLAETEPRTLAKMLMEAKPSSLSRGFEMDKVYLAYRSEFNRGLIIYKIGITGVHWKRIGQLNRDYLGEWAFEHHINCYGARELTILVEKSLHYLFASKRHPYYPKSKEFFNLDIKDRRWIKSLDYVDCSILERLITTKRAV